MKLNLTSIGSHGDYHMGHQTWASKLAQANEGGGLNLPFSMQSPTLVCDV